MSAETTRPPYRKYVVAAFAPDGQRTGDTGRRFWTRWGAERERSAYAAYVPVMVPRIVDGKPDRSLPLVRLVTYRVVADGNAASRMSSNRRLDDE